LLVGVVVVASTPVEGEVRVDIELLRDKLLLQSHTQLQLAVVAVAVAQVTMAEMALPLLLGR
jgi:hypothetical protein